MKKRLNHFQRAFADRLSRRTQYWNTGSKVIALALFILLFGGACLWLLIRSFFYLLNIE